MADNVERLNNEQELYNQIKPAGGALYLTVKRFLDLMLSIAALVLLFFPMIVIAVAIWIDDPTGSPLFSQTRCGQNGEQFTMYKFRTMCMDAERKIEELKALNEMDGPVFKIAKDPRITRVGSILRKSGLDELPQLINVVSGKMSLVGPRPPLPAEVNQYSSYQNQRLLVIPGLTCLWQIAPKRNELSFEEWIKLDFEYICNRCLLLDVKIVLLTFRSIIHGEGL